MLRLMRSKAQSTAEYAIVIGVVIAVALAMQVYVKRGLQAKVKGVTDFNDAKAVADGILGKTVSGQFEPDYTTTTGDGMHTTSDTSETATTTEGGGVSRNIEGTDITSRTGTQVTKGE